MIWDPTDKIDTVGAAPSDRQLTKPYTKAAKQHTPEACVACHSRAQGRPGKCFQPAVRKVVEFVSELVWDIHGYPPIAILIRKIVIIIHWELAISYFQTNSCGSVSPRRAEKTTCDSIARGGMPPKN